MRWGARSPKNFSALRVSVWSKNKGGAAPPPLPWIRHCFMDCPNIRLVSYNQPRSQGLHRGVDLRTDDFLGTKISSMHRQPSFLTHGAPLPRLKVWLSGLRKENSVFSHVTTIYANLLEQKKTFA